MTLLAKRKEQAQYVASGLKDQLNTVVPVSASIYCALKESKSKFEKWDNILKQIPNEAFEYLMSSEECFEENDIDVLHALYEGTSKEPISLSERRELRGQMAWSVFRTIATCLYESENIGRAVAELEDVAGIENVRDVLNNTFFKRAKNIRCFNAILGLEKMLYDLSHRNLKILRDRCALFPKAQTHIAYCRDNDVRNMLMESVKQYVVSKESINEIEGLLKKFQREIEALHIKLERDDRNFAMLHNLEKERDSFSREEYDELCVLFGLYEGKIPENVNNRQSYWNYIANCAANKNIQEMAEYAVEIYSEVKS